MLLEDSQLPEINYMKHRNDDSKNYVDYEKSILVKTLSPYIFSNNIMNSYLLKLQKLSALMFDRYNVNKYYYKHVN
jgi:hypothetical protein